LVHPSPICAATAAESLELFELVGDPWHAALSKVLLAVEGVTGLHAERSEMLLLEADELFTKEGDEWGPAVIGFVRMETAIKAGHVDRAISIGSATAAAFRQLDDPWGLSAILYHLGWGLRQFGRFEEGARVLEQAIDAAEAAGLWNTVQWAYADLAIEKVHVGQFDIAKGLFDRAATASRNVGDGAGEVLAGYGYGLLAQVRGDWQEARRHYRDAVRGFERLGTPVMMGMAMAGLARCDESDGDSVSAGRGYDEALAIGRRLREPALTASAIEGLARLSLSHGKLEDGSRLLVEAGEIRTTSSRPAPPHEKRDLEAALRTSGTATHGASPRS
jgi:tetratricopeptide (TPR) repeat protein